ncbi:hypothetical protein [Streptomyces sp. NRRL B-3648]|uniref:hypothetical protein n=1 Tax=Streptomyces sp. NRRL B-3648 TaxID=1519493 RepID=UPI001F442395|nr:hypothetical protein [Streptomyces sp. NRRL B-3648]
MVVEVGLDVARDVSGRWRHPARLHRARPEPAPASPPPMFRAWGRRRADGGAIECDGPADGRPSERESGREEGRHPQCSQGLMSP